MSKKVPRLLVVFSLRRSDTSTAFGGFVARLKKQGGLEDISMDYVALEDLMFYIKGKKAEVTDIRTGKRLDDYDWVYFKSWEGSPDRAAALATFFQAKGIPFVDNAVIHKGGGNKLVSHMRFWADDLPVATTVYAAPNHLLQILPTLTLEYPLVIKAVNGQKGRDNFLANTFDEATKILKDNPHTEFLIQELIPNTHDLRVQVYGGKARLVIKRKASAESHLNNTSKGGEAELIPLKDCDQKMLHLAEKAAAAVDLNVSGVDVMPNSQTGKYYILEANQGSQVVTGKFTEENMSAFNAYLRTQAKIRLTRTQDKHSKLTIVGRHEVVDLPDFGVFHADAKVDTGAYRSSIHAKDVKVIKKHGKDVLQFSLPTVAEKNGKLDKYATYEFEDFDVVPVKKSSTVTEKRYIIRTRLRIAGRTFTTSFTLTDRSKMRFPVLVGRRVLRGRFIVNTELSQHN